MEFARTMDEICHIETALEAVSCRFVGSGKHTGSSFMHFEEIMPIRTLSGQVTGCNKNSFTRISKNLYFTPKGCVKVHH